MIENQSVGHFWPTFFSLKEEELKKIYHDIDWRGEFEPDVDMLVYHFNMSERLDISDKDIQNVVCKAIFEWCLIASDFAKDVLKEEDYAKACELFKRKQQGASLKRLLAKFESAFVIENTLKLKEKFKLILASSISIGMQELKEKKVASSFLPLKKKMDEIASGVKADCYLNPNVNCAMMNEGFSNELNVYIKEKHGYDYNSHLQGKQFSLYCNESRSHADKMLRKWVILESEFWVEHPQFSIVKFIDNVEKYNSFKHATKIIDYIFGEIKKDALTKSILEKNLVIVDLSREQIRESIEERISRFTFERFSDKAKRKIAKQEMTYLSYPILGENKLDNEIEEGREIFSQFIKFLYKDNSEKVLSILSNLDTVINEFYSQGEQDKKGVTIANYFDMTGFCALPNKPDVELAKILHPHFFQEKNVLARVYLKCYLTKLIVGDIINTCLFEIFYDILKCFEIKFGLKTSLQLDTALRNEKYNVLSQILKNYNFDITISKHKTKYIIALLDRKMATIDEAECFPELEQLGDSIYDLAIAELIFYNPHFLCDDEIRKIGCDKMRERYRSAKFQIEISKKLGFEKAYVCSSSKDEVLYKYDEEELGYEEFINAERDTKEKFLADSLEMIIGVVTNEFGIEKALEFSKILISKTDNKLGFQEKEMDASKMLDKTKTLGIDKDYWTMIYPAPFSSMNKLHRFLWHSLNKVLLCEFIGTEAKAKRQTITHSFGSSTMYGIYGEGFNTEISPIFYDYLDQGIGHVVKKYKDKIKIGE